MQMLGDAWHRPYSRQDRKYHKPRSTPRPDRLTTLTGGAARFQSKPVPGQCIVGALGVAWPVETVTSDLVPTASGEGRNATVEAEPEPGTITAFPGVNRVTGLPVSATMQSVTVSAKLDSITAMRHNTVMIEHKPTAELSLDELSLEVERLMESSRLIVAQPDHRVSATPDARTIRYYTTLGLLDRPTIQGRQARYSHRHVLQLLAIKALQLTSLPLAEIQSRLYGLRDDELEAVVTSVAASLSASVAQTARLIKPIYWKEIVIEPGLKIVAEEGWSPAMDPALIIERLKTAIASLQMQTRPTNGGRGDVHISDQ